MARRTPSNRTLIVDAYNDTPLVNTSTDATTAILDALAANGRAELLAGVYSINPGLTSLVIDGLLLGQGVRRTTLKLLAGQTGIGLRLASNSKIRDFTLEGNGEASTTAIAPVSGGAAYNLLVERVRLKDCASGVGSNGAFRGLRLANCEFENNTRGIFNTSAGVSAIDVIGCSFKDNTTHLEFQSAPRGGMILGNDVEGGTTGLNLGSGRDFFVAGNRINVSGTALAAGGGIRNNFGPNYNAAAEIDGPALVLNSMNRFLGHFYWSAEPTSGVWYTGDFIHNRSAGSTGAVEFAWQCTTGGTAGAGAAFAKLYRGQKYLTYSGSWTPGGVSAGSSVGTQVEVVGAVAGDFVLPAFTGNLPGGCSLHAESIGAGLVDVQIKSDSAQTIGAGTLKLRVYQ